MTAEEFYAKDRKTLHAWLEKNFTRDKGLWLVYDKKAEKERILTYTDIVEELLCFGWIDSTAGSVDEKRGKIFISPRRSKSPWSKINKGRIEVLLKKKLIKKAGLDVINKAKKDGSWAIYDAIDKLEIPEDLEKALLKNKRAKENFDKFSNSGKKQIYWYVVNSKREETRKAHIEKVVEAAQKNINPLQ